ncbi:hypothetical protein JHK85_001003 [Glycine max]|nr:hypothetical protein JHK85_001003 [Glycine max]
METSVMLVGDASRDVCVNLTRQGPAWGCVRRCFELAAHMESWTMWWPLAMMMGIVHLSSSLDADCLVQRTGWTRDPDVFFLWLSSIPFSGGGFNDAVIAEGLAEALMSETEQGMDHLLGSKQDKPKIWKVYTCRKAKGVESELVRS